MNNNVKLIYEQYQMLHNLAIDTYSNDLFSANDVVDNFGLLTESVIINIMELLGYTNDEEFAFESINNGIMDGDSFEYVLDKLDSFKVKKEIDSYALKPKPYPLNPNSKIIIKPYSEHKSLDGIDFIESIKLVMSKGGFVDNNS